MCALQVNVIHTANPMEHANNAMVQPQFINPVHHASVDLSGHNLVNAHQASGEVLPHTHIWPVASMSFRFQVLGFTCIHGLNSHLEMVI